MKATVVEETLTDNSTVYNVMLKGEDVANPASKVQASIIAARMNCGRSALAAVASLELEASVAIGETMATIIDELLASDVEAFRALIEHVQTLGELGVDLTRTDVNDFLLDLTVFVVTVAMMAIAFYALGELVGH